MNEMDKEDLEEKYSNNWEFSFGRSFFGLLFTMMIGLHVKEVLKDYYFVALIKQKKQNNIADFNAEQAPPVG